jgi:hypothetical protein
MGCTLRLRWMWQQWVEPSKPSDVLPLYEDVVTKAFFKTLIQCIMGYGRSSLFWLDPWVDGWCIADMAPNLLAVVHPRRRNKRTMATALQQNALLRDIIRALTIPVFMQYVKVRECLEADVLDPPSPDATIW